ncbi:pilus assembly protein (plasmid) [Pontibacillus sp. ALD_SL1]|uniref:TadE family protein n=1 Tax=Pontibacillus sp. ALD_SL1 TaxID=2777185 RepID=UPI001A9592BB|nr:TadE family protein [Pontibacillus sp. ALD_SL1]QST02975.1 pilus assembly protein [Pontibacillus sp. ALD_SL1]
MKKKKGSIIVELLAALPVLFLVAWSAMQIIFYSNAMSTMHGATMEGARTLSSELRGYEGPMPTSGVQHDELKTKLLNKMANTTQFSNLILLFHDEEKPLSPEVIFEDQGKCDTAMNNNNNHRVICAYTVMSTVPGTGVDQEQIVVKAKARFWVIGNFIPGLKETMFADGMGVSQKELSGRYQYYK